MVSSHVPRPPTYFALFFPVTFQGKYEEADPLHDRSLAILEKVLGPDHPDVAVVLNNGAESLHRQVTGIGRF